MDEGALPPLNEFIMQKQSLKASFHHGSCYLLINIQSRQMEQHGNMGILNPLMCCLCMYLHLNWFIFLQLLQILKKNKQKQNTTAQCSCSDHLLIETLTCQVVSLTSETGCNHLILILPGGDSHTHTHTVCVDMHRMVMVNDCQYKLCLSQCRCFTVHYPFAKQTSVMHHMSESIEHALITCLIFSLYMWFSFAAVQSHEMLYQGHFFKPCGTSMRVMTSTY